MEIIINMIILLQEIERESLHYYYDYYCSAVVSPTGQQRLCVQLLCNFLVATLEAPLDRRRQECSREPAEPALCWLYLCHWVLHNRVIFRRPACTARSLPFKLTSACLSGRHWHPRLSGGRRAREHSRPCSLHVPSPSHTHKHVCFLWWAKITLSVY